MESESTTSKLYLTALSVNCTKKSSRTVLPKSVSWEAYLFHARYPLTLVRRLQRAKVVSYTIDVRFKNLVLLAVFWCSTVLHSQDITVHKPRPVLFLSDELIRFEHIGLQSSTCQSFYARGGAKIRVRHLRGLLPASEDRGHRSCAHSRLPVPDLDHLRPFLAEGS